MKKQKKGSKKRGGGWFIWLGDESFRMALLRMLRPPFLLIILVLLGYWVIEWVSTQARAFECFQVYPNAVRCTSRPAWLASSDRMTTEIVGQIQTAFSAYPPDSIFEDELEEALKSRPASFSPWIESVTCFQRIYPSRFRIELKLRRPVACFEHQGRSYFIDGLGVVITAVKTLDQGFIRTGLPLITGIGSSRNEAIQEGSAALDRRLIEGAAVAREIEIFYDKEISPAIKIAEIDVSNIGRGRPDDVVLRTGEGVRILWGRSSLNPRYQGIDPSPEFKASKLRSLLDKRPGLLGLAEVNVAFRDAKTTFRLSDEGS